VPPDGDPVDPEIDGSWRDCVEQAEEVEGSLASFDGLDFHDPDVHDSWIDTLERAAKLKADIAGFEPFGLPDPGVFDEYVHFLERLRLWPPTNNRRQKPMKA
jgi:hypothetical protein